MRPFLLRCSAVLFLVSLCVRADDGTGSDLVPFQVQYPASGADPVILQWHEDVETQPQANCWFAAVAPSLPQLKWIYSKYDADDRTCFAPQGLIADPVGLGRAWVTRAANSPDVDPQAALSLPVLQYPAVVTGITPSNVVVSVLQEQATSSPQVRLHLAHALSPEVSVECAFGQGFDNTVVAQVDSRSVVCDLPRLRRGTPGGQANPDSLDIEVALVLSPGQVLSVPEDDTAGSVSVHVVFLRNATQSSDTETQEQTGQAGGTGSQGSVYVSSFLPHTAEPAGVVTVTGGGFQDSAGYSCVLTVAEAAAVPPEPSAFVTISADWKAEDELECLLPADLSLPSSNVTATLAVQQHLGQNVTLLAWDNQESSRALIIRAASSHPDESSASSRNPLVEKVEPVTGPPGTVLGIIGRNFNASDHYLCWFASSASSVATWQSDILLECPVPFPQSDMLAGITDAVSLRISSAWLQSDIAAMAGELHFLYAAFRVEPVLPQQNIAYSAWPGQSFDFLLEPARSAADSAEIWCVTIDPTTEQVRSSDLAGRLAPKQTQRDRVRCIVPLDAKADTTVRLAVAVTSTGQLSSEATAIQIVAPPLIQAIVPNHGRVGAHIRLFGRDLPRGVDPASVRCVFAVGAEETATVGQEMLCDADSGDKPCQKFPDSPVFFECTVPEAPAATSARKASVALEFSSGSALQQFRVRTEGSLEFKFDQETVPLMHSVFPTSGASTGGTELVISGVHLPEIPTASAESYCLFTVLAAGQVSGADDKLEFRTSVVVHASKATCTTPDVSAAPGVAQLQLVLAGQPITAAGGSLLSFSFIRIPRITAALPANVAVTGADQFTVTLLGSGFSDQSECRASSIRAQPGIYFDVEDSRLLEANTRLECRFSINAPASVRSGWTSIYVSASNNGRDWSEDEAVRVIHSPPGDTAPPAPPGYGQAPVSGPGTLPFLTVAGMVGVVLVYRRFRRPSAAIGTSRDAQETLPLYHPSTRQANMKAD